MDIIGLGALFLAAFVIIKLRSILGETHWDDTQQKEQTDKNDGFASPNAKNQTTMKPSSVSDDASYDNVIDLPKRYEKSATELTQQQKEQKLQVFLDKNCKGDEKLQKVLLSFYKKDNTFDIETFYKSALQAYEMIVTAFGSGDKKTLSDLLSKKIYSKFEKEIDNRVKRGEVHSFDFIGVEKSEIIDASLTKNSAKIKIRFMSSFFHVVYSKDKEIIEGNEKKSMQAVDLWSFSRDFSSQDPVWYLTATQSE